MNRRLVVLTIVLAAAAAGRLRLQAIEPGAPSHLNQLPFTLGDWTGRRGPELDPAVRAVLGADDYVSRIYGGAIGEGALYVGYHRSQSSGDSIHSPLNCLPGSGWQPIHAERVALGNRGFVREVLIQKGEEQQLVVYWYQSWRRIEGDEYRSKLYMVLDAMRWRRNDAALVRVVAPIDSRAAGGAATARRTAYALAALAEPEVRQILFP